MRGPNDAWQDLVDDPNIMEDGVKEGLDLTDEADSFLTDYAAQVEQRGSKMVRVPRRPTGVRVCGTLAGER